MCLHPGPLSSKQLSLVLYVKFGSAATSIANILQVQAVPAIVAGVLPAVLQASNPGAAIAGALGGALNKSNQPVSTTATGAGGSGNAPQTVISQSPTTLQQSVLDPAYASAATVKPILDTFYEFLGGEKGEIDWDKLSDAPPAATEGSANSKPLPQGVTFVLGNLNGLKSATHATETEPSKALMAAFEKATKVHLHSRRV